MNFLLELKFFVLSHPLASKQPRKIVQIHMHHPVYIYIYNPKKLSLEADPPLSTNAPIDFMNQIGSPHLNFINQKGVSPFRIHQSKGPYDYFICDKKD